MHWLAEWISSNDFMPHGFCYQWKPALVWLHAVSDTLIALAYFSIPVALIHLVRKRGDIPFSWMFFCFGTFIAACGATHVMEVWTVWIPSYWFAGGVKVVTALASIPTAVALVRMMPQAMSLPNPASLRIANEELLRQDAILKKSEERFRQMAENIQEIFWTMNPHTMEATYVSPAFEQICELPVDALYSIPTSYRNLIHPEDRPRVLAELANLEHTNRFDQEFRIVCPSGAVKWLHAIGFNAKDQAGVLQSFVGTVQEITHRKEMEAALRESEDLFRDLVEHSSDLICTHTLDGRLLSVNETPVKLLGYTREEMLNKPMREFLLQEARAQFDQSLLNIKRDGFAKGLMVVLTKTGERRIWEYHNTLRTDCVNSPIVRGIAHDVTEQKRAEQDLRRLSGQLLRSQDEERRGIARDLHDTTGQNLVVLSTSLAQLQAFIPSSNRKSRKLLAESQALADQCIREVRTLSYVLHPPMLEEAGLQDAISLYAEGFTKRSGIRVILEVSPGFGRLDRNIELTLFRVVQESLTNIRRHSGSREAKIRFDRGPQKITMEISDRGNGFSSHPGQGTGKSPFALGVGVASMQERVKFIGGRLDIESGSSGATVRVTVPANE
jgi:PAS domain S-box-containing protein